MNETSITLTLNDRDEALPLFGSRDQNLRAIREALGVRLIARGDTLQIEGSEGQTEQAERVFQQLRQMLRQQGKISPEDVRTVLDVVDAVLFAAPVAYLWLRTDGWPLHQR